MGTKAALIIMGDVTNLRAQLEARKVAARKWAAERGPLIRDTAIQHIEADLLVDSQCARLKIADGLRQLAAWYAVHGQISLLDERPTARLELHRSWLCQCFSLKLVLSEFEKGKFLREFRPISSLQTHASYCAWAILYALMVGDETESAFLESAIRVMLQDNDVVPRRYWELQSRGLEHFSLQLLTLKRGEQSVSFAECTRKSGPYRRITDEWRNVKNLPGLIRDACDFHCECMAHSTMANDEFRRPPYDLLPAEVLAISAVRRTLGIDEISVDHPLLAYPFGLAYESSPKVEDPMLKRIEHILQ